MWPDAVALEPAFRPFRGHFAPPGNAVIDDGRKPTLLSSLFEGLTRSAASADQAGFAAWAQGIAAAPEPALMARDREPVAIQIMLPAGAKVSRDVAEQLLVALAVRHLPLAFEVIGLPEGVLIQLAGDSDDVVYVRDQVLAHFPDAILTEHERFLADRWLDDPDADFVIADFGLSEEEPAPPAMPRTPAVLRFRRCWSPPVATCVQPVHRRLRRLARQFRLRTSRTCRTSSVRCQQLPPS